MRSSYRRKCLHCGRWIQLRQMPHGQWVAFEGYNTLHRCDEPHRRSPDEGLGDRQRAKQVPAMEDAQVPTSEVRSRRPNAPAGDDALDFPDIDVSRAARTKPHAKATDPVGDTVGGRVPAGGTGAGRSGCTTVVAVIVCVVGACGVLLLW